MNEILSRLYQQLIETNLPEILNGSQLLRELRYLVVVAVAPCSPHGIAKTGFNRRELEQIAKTVRLDFEYYHEAPEILEERLAKSNLISASKKDSGWTYYSPTPEGTQEVVRRVELLQTLSEITELKQKMVAPMTIKVKSQTLPRALARLTSRPITAAEISLIEEELVSELSLRLDS